MIKRSSGIHPSASSSIHSSALGDAPECIVFLEAKIRASSSEAEETTTALVEEVEKLGRKLEKKVPISIRGYDLNALATWPDDALIFKGNETWGEMNVKTSAKEIHVQHLSGTIKCSNLSKHKPDITFPSPYQLRPNPRSAC